MKKRVWALLELPVVVDVTFATASRKEVERAQVLVVAGKCVLRIEDSANAPFLPLTHTLSLRLLSLSLVQGEKTPGGTG